MVVKVTLSHDKKKSGPFITITGSIYLHIFDARDHFPADHPTCGGCCLILFSMSLDTFKSKCKDQSSDIIVTPSATIHL